MEERLNKVLARAGLASRRGADELVAAGRVTVNGTIVTELGTKVDPSTDEVRVDGERIRAQAEQTHRYLALYKPRHVLSTVSDPFDRPTVLDFIEPGERLFPVGRLDGASEGLILLTNDGDMANQLTHPRYEHEKEYRAKISGTPTEKTLQTWREGVWLEEGRTLPAHVTIEKSRGSSTWVRFVLREGKNRQIRRMVEALNHTVHQLIRTRVGPITLAGLKPGAWRALTEAELEALRAGSNEPVVLEGSPEAATRSSQNKRQKLQYKAGWARPKPRNRPSAGRRGAKGSTPSRKRRDK